MKKLLSILLAVLLLLAAAVPALAVEPTPTADARCFFANGASITIQAAAPAGGSEQAIAGINAGTDAYIVWDTDKYVGVKNDTIVYGASDNVAYTGDTFITMTGGEVATIYGGGRARCKTIGNATIEVSGGTVGFVMGGGANGGGGNTTTDPNDNVVNNVVINITGGNTTYVMGGGQGHSTVGVTEINFGGTATASEIIGSGSNGNTGSTTVNVTGGSADAVFSVNRGTITDAEINITGGTVGKAAIGALSDSTNTTGTFAIDGSGSLKISGGATVTDAYLGKGLFAADVFIDSTVPVQARSGKKNEHGEDGKKDQVNLNANVTIAAGSTLTVDNADFLILDSDSSINNRGTIDNKGIFALLGEFENVGKFDNSGTLDNAGTLTNLGTLTNTGTINNSLSIQAEGESEPTVVPGTIKNTGTLSNSGDGTIDNTAGKITSNNSITGVTGNAVVVIKPTRSSGSVEPDTVYDVTRGQDGRTFTCDGPYSKFVGVKVDGVSLKDTDYDVKSGSTILTLKQSYYDTLAKGEHTLRMGYQGGYGTVTFTVGTGAAAAVESNPDTGANDVMALAAALAVVSLCAAGYTLKKKQ